MSDRLDHLDYMLNKVNELDIGTSDKYIGGMKQEKLDIAEKADIIFSTYSMSSEALDISSLNTIILSTSRKNVEQSVGRILRNQKPPYDKLNIMMKVEAFSDVLDQTKGVELSKMLWLRSQNSEVWLDRRTTYTRSLAVMSMAGYILGLGDRHPSNLLLDRISGRIVHIDFGDCVSILNMYNFLVFSIVLLLNFYLL